MMQRRRMKADVSISMDAVYNGELQEIRFKTVNEDETEIWVPELESPLMVRSKELATVMDLLQAVKHQVDCYVPEPEPEPKRRRKPKPRKR